MFSGAPGQEVLVSGLLILIGAVAMTLAQSLTAIIIFWALTQTVPPQAAILGGFAAARVVFWYNRLVRLFSWLTVFGFVVVAVGAVVGVGLMLRHGAAALAFRVFLVTIPNFITIARLIAVPLIVW